MHKLKYIYNNFNYKDFVIFFSIILPFPDGFTHYILKDGVVLPQR